MATGLYQVSPNNCEDTFTFGAGNRRFVIDHPDSAGVDEMTYYRDAILTVFDGNTMVAGPIKLPTTACYASAPTNVCSSGGMCAIVAPPP